MDEQIFFLNGEVITVNNNDDVVEAVAIKGGRVTATGSNEDILALKNEESKVIDLEGKTLMPGFIDPHLHISMYGTNTISISCKSESVKSLDDLMDKLKKEVERTSEDDWIRAWGYNETLIEERRFPKIEELDEISKNHPIIITRTCGHISVVNSKALEIAGINEGTPNPEGGKIERDEEGNPTGLLLENAHMEMFNTAAFTKEELTCAHKVASEHFLAKGITSIHDAGGYGLSNINALQTDSKNGVIKQRLYVMAGALYDAQSVVKHMVAAGIYTGLGDSKFRIGPVKLFLDGSSSGPTVWSREGYTSDPENYGIHYFSQEEVDDLFIPAHKNGWQITAHAQGDAAIDMLLNTIEKANHLHPREDARHRIEHAGIAAPDLINRMKEQNVIPIPNPAFLYEYGEGYVKNYGERAGYMYPLGDYQRSGIPAAIASDSPVTDYDPMRGLHAAVTRESNAGNVIGEDKKVSLLEAIRMYTLNGAYASFEEDIKGSIEPGKVADLIMLDRSILNCDTAVLPEVQVDGTMIEGEVVYSRL
ncbi:amidohydrolase [Lacicoccus alkaliphilus]|uniref:Amidohydrolase 3 domain-containing protein n=1 Tax=Lacicoccus alkaliphilus DSM 16010 TaxID=1123231 RepID=A0A1M7JK47_9BACL|nr:amidohydrolase [Salinicoccus alkaliphilus]SHM52867.1 hypothetical protein SAMN02745189_02314 [Salinicoccus alkaliphilus DSM 16010]